jgi:adenylate cyclase
VKHLDYSSRARYIALTYPRLNFIAIQVTFWLAAFLILAGIAYMTSHALSHAFGTGRRLQLAPLLILNSIGGLVYGVLNGVSEGWLEARVQKARSLGVEILLRVLLYLCVLAVMMGATRYFVWEHFVLPYYFGGETPAPRADEASWNYYGYAVLIYTFPMSFVISFINQMNKKFGPGILVPMLLGRYRHPREERRVFIFMDLESSTTHAETLGHIEYSAMLRDSFLDINRVVSRYRAEVYQYVGDEIVVSWPADGRMDRLACVQFFFDCQLLFMQKEAHYKGRYGFIPRFKAGLHQGIVTAVEVGDIKRDIAYHGDTLNTASRIQAKCKEYGSDLLISDEVEKAIDWPGQYSKTFVGQVALRGKHAPVNLFDVKFSI